MSCFDSHPEPLRIELFGEQIRDLTVQSLLELRAPGEIGHNPSKSPEPGDPAVWDVRDAYGAKKRQQVVRA
jgi:hypothetical protein